MVEPRLPAGDAEAHARTRRDGEAPGDSPTPALELDEAPRLELGKPHEHAGGDPRPDVRYDHAADVASPRDAPLFGPCGQPERLCLGEGERFQPWSDGGEAVQSWRWDRDLFWPAGRLRARRHPATLIAPVTMRDHRLQSWQSG